MTVHHISRAVASTGAATPPYRVHVRVGEHELEADEPVGRGGGDHAPPPFGLLVSGLAACTATTLRMYAERKGWPLETIGVDARLDVDDDGRRSIARTITLPPDVPEDQRVRLAEVAERTPVTMAVRDGTPIATTFRTT